MAVGKSWSHTVAVGSYNKGTGYATFYFEQNYDAATNSSRIHLTRITVTHSNFDGYYYSGQWKVNATITADGVSVASGEWEGQLVTAGVPAELTGTLPVVGGAIAHNTDGSKSVNINITINTIVGVNAGWIVRDKSDTHSVTLTTIPLASTIVATDANVGSVSQITVTRKSTNYSHSIQYAFGALSGYVTSSGGISSDFNTFTTTSIGFTIPEAFYTQIPNSKTGTCTLRVTTYSGNTQIGDSKTCSFTVTAAQSLCTPSVSGTVVDTNESTIALTGSADILVRYMSDALCTISTEAKNSATVSSKTIAGVTVTENTRTIVGIETDTVKFGVTDSRGYYNSVDVVKSFVPYIKLTNNSTAVRPDPTSGKVTLKIEGSCFNGNFGVVDNIVNATYSVNSGNPVDATVVMSGNAYSITLNLTGFDYQSSYSIEVVVTDKLMTVTRTLPIQKGIPVFDWGEDDFRFNVEVDFADRGQTIRNLMTWDTPNGDFNDCVQPGFYWMQLPYCTNAPMSDGYGFLEVIQTHKEYNSGIMQRFTEYYSHQVFVRSYINGGWNSWTNPAYPVGSVYMSMDSTSPAKLFGGTWEQRTDRFLVAAGNAYEAGATGGSSSVTLTVDQIPSHTHIAANYMSMVGWTGASPSYSYLNNNNDGYVGSNNPTTKATGGGLAHENRPPYLAVYMWIRTA